MLDYIAERGGGVGWIRRKYTLRIPNFILVIVPCHNSSWPRRTMSPKLLRLPAGFSKEQLRILYKSSNGARSQQNSPRTFEDSHTSYKYFLLKINFLKRFASELSHNMWYFFAEIILKEDLFLCKKKYYFLHIRDIHMDFHFKKKLFKYIN